jgi:thioesterase domain-containing protein/acyl carrier protein
MEAYPREGLASDDPEDSARAVDVAQIFAEIFELERVATDVDFFRLGGDSIVAAALTNEIERRFGVGLSLSVLLEASTPESLAGAIMAASRERQERVLIPVRPQGSGPAIFCIHGTNGESLFPHRLAGVLGQDRPIFGLRAFGLEAGECPPATVEGMADLYLSAATAEQPSGGYVLLGHCAGAVVAWEMARRMTASGRDVAGVILLDPESELQGAPFLHRSGLALEMYQAGAVKLGSEVSANFETNPPQDAEARRRFVRRAIGFAIACYTPKPLDVPALLISSEERRPMHLNPERGYQRLLGKLKSVEFAGKHGSIFNTHLEGIAAEIRAFLDPIAPLAAADQDVAKMRR